MLNYKYSELNDKLKVYSNVILFGAGDIGELAKYALNKILIKENFYCDNDKRKQNKNYLGTKVISPKELEKLDKDLKEKLNNQMPRNQKWHFQL